jgi:hypothetical protein
LFWACCPRGWISWATCIRHICILPWLCLGPGLCNRSSKINTGIQDKPIITNISAINLWKVTELPKKGISDLKTMGTIDFTKFYTKFYSSSNIKKILKKSYTFKKVFFLNHHRFTRPAYTSIWDPHFCTNLFPENHATSQTA